MDTKVGSSFYSSFSDAKKIAKNAEKLVKAIVHGKEREVRRLIEKGVDINKKDENGRLPLIIAWDASRKNKNIVNYLIDEMIRQDQSPVLMACENNNEDLLKYLWENGFDLNQGDDNGITPLLVACERGYRNLVEYLVRHGADVNQGDNDGVTPLLVACEKNYVDLAKYLLECGAQINIKDRMGRVPVLLAWENKRLLGYFVDEMTMFEEKTFGDILLILACKTGDEYLARWLIDEERATTHNKRYLDKESLTNETKKMKITHMDKEKHNEYVEMKFSRI